MDQVLLGAGNSAGEQNRHSSSFIGLTVQGGEGGRVTHIYILLTANWAQLPQAEGLVVSGMCERLVAGAKMSFKERGKGCGGVQRAPQTPVM